MLKLGPSPHPFLPGPSPKASSLPEIVKHTICRGVGGVLFVELAFWSNLRHRLSLTIDPLLLGVVVNRMSKEVDDRYKWGMLQYLAPVECSTQTSP
jgi:hypothetical protein